MSLLSALAEVDVPSWRSRAACRGRSPAIFFPVGKDPSAYAQARLICAGCPVREDCLETHLAEQLGLWGGLSPPERVALRRRRGLLAPRRRRERR